MPLTLAYQYEMLARISLTGSGAYRACHLRSIRRIGREEHCIGHVRRIGRRGAFGGSGGIAGSCSSRARHLTLT